MVIDVLSNRGQGYLATRKEERQQAIEFSKKRNDCRSPFILVNSVSHELELRPGRHGGWDQFSSSADCRVAVLGHWPCFLPTTQFQWNAVWEISTYLRYLRPEAPVEAWPPLSTPP